MCFLASLVFMWQLVSQLLVMSTNINVSFSVSLVLFFHPLANNCLFINYYVLGCLSSVSILCNLFGVQRLFYLIILTYIQSERYPLSKSRWLSGSCVFDFLIQCFGLDFYSFLIPLLFCWVTQGLHKETHKWMTNETRPLLRFCRGTIT